MHPLKHGKEIDLVEIGANWYVDDLPPMMFMKKAPNSHGFVNPRDIEDLWRDAFDWVYREMDYGVFAFTIHPDVAGRPQVLLMLERLIEHINGKDGTKWMTFEEIAADFRKRFPFKGKQASRGHLSVRQHAPAATGSRPAPRQRTDADVLKLRFSGSARPLDRGGGGDAARPAARPVPPCAGAAIGAAGLWPDGA